MHPLVLCHRLSSTWMDGVRRDLYLVCRACKMREMPWGRRRGAGGERKRRVGAFSVSLPRLRARLQLPSPLSTLGVLFHYYMNVHRMFEGVSLGDKEEEEEGGRKKLQPGTETGGERPRTHLSFLSPPSALALALLPEGSARSLRCVPRRPFPLPTLVWTTSSALLSSAKGS